MNILFVAPYVPSVIRRRPLAFIQGLASRGHDIIFVGLTDSYADRQSQQQFSQYCTGVHLFSKNKIRSLWDSFRCLFKRQCLQAGYTFSKPIQEKIRRIISNWPVDIVHLEHIRAVSWLPAMQLPPIVFDSVDCISDLYVQLARELPPGVSKVIAAVEAKQLAVHEPAVLQRAQGVIVSSFRDKHGLKLLAAEHHKEPPPIRVISNGVDCDHFSPAGEDIDLYSIVFIGKMGYLANFLAAKHFLNDILPRIKAIQPNAKFTIVGANPPSDLKMLKQRDVAVTGGVPDIRPYLSAAHVVICPLRISVGIQNKLLEAMAAGKGIVTYPGPAMSICDDDRNLFLVADDPEAFAGNVIKLFQSDALRIQLGTNARTYVKEKFNWEHQTDRLERFYNEVLTADSLQRVLHHE